jgi:hypothetical protein
LLRLRRLCTGAKGCVDIADFAAANEAELSQIVDLPHGTPSHDSFSRLFRLLDLAEMTDAFARFQAALRAELGLPPAKGVVAVDGKSWRRGYERGRSFMPAADDQRLGRRDAPVAGEPPCAGRRRSGGDPGGAESRDPERLHRHRRRLASPPAQASQIRAQGGHYALKLKANHGPLFACALKAFAAADANGELPSYEQVESGDGRQERCRACVIAAPADAPTFPDLAAFGRIESERRQGDGKPTRWLHYLALSVWQSLNCQGPRGGVPVRLPSPGCTCRPDS